MNCYYSNLIEGHDTHPIDIERALKNDYSKDARKRDLQLEAKAHIAVQQWIDQGGVKGRSMTLDAVCEIHRRFYEQVPEELRWMDDPVTKERLKIVPGELRHRDVQVGQHVGISPGAVPRFLRRFEEAFSKLGEAESVLATAAAHHRLVWIHPFLDGNGRVVRLMSHATLLDILEIEVRGKRGVGYCKSMPSAVKPYRRLLNRPLPGLPQGKRARRRRGENLDDPVQPQEARYPQPTAPVFPGNHIKLFNGVLRRTGLKKDRDGNPRTAYSLRHTYICMRLMEGADIYQIAKNCRTSVEMIEKFYAAHIKNTLDAAAINVRRSKPTSRKGAKPRPPKPTDDEDQE